MYKKERGGMRIQAQIEIELEQKKIMIFEATNRIILNLFSAASSSSKNVEEIRNDNRIYHNTKMGFR